jgi:glycosyltransferase involved in cell wall biosynthesis
MAPLFSVVIPTRNRAHLLPFALESVFAQTFTDLEIVINDNCSDDETPEVVQRLADRRIRYFRNTESIPLAQNWQAALDHAKGEYVIFLPDDDALSSVTFESVANVIKEHNPQMVVWKYCYYYENHWENPDYPRFHPFSKVPSNTLTVPYFSMKQFEAESSMALEQMFQKVNGYVPDLPSPAYFGRGPQLTNAVYHRSLIARLQAKEIPLMTTYASDIYSGVLTIWEAGKYYYLDCPFSVYRVAEDSASASLTRRGKAMVSYFERFPEERHMEHVPLKSWSNSNNFAEMLLRAKKALGDRLAGIEIDWVQYYIKCHTELFNLSRRGIDVNEELREFDEVLAAEPAEIQTRVRSAIRNNTENRIGFTARSILLRSSLLMKLISRIQPALKLNRQIAIRGSDAGFQDISACAKLLDASFLRGLAAFWLNASVMNPSIGKLI